MTCGATGNTMSPLVAASASVRGTATRSNGDTSDSRSVSACASASDPGSWELSPEWWGSQGGGWGRSAGELCFQQRSNHGNGWVTVTAHETQEVRRAGRQLQLLGIHGQMDGWVGERGDGRRRESGLGGWLTSIAASQ